jgi:hypothetical protein
MAASRSDARGADDQSATPSARARIGLALVVLVSLAGGIAMVVASPHGVHVTNDSFSYLGAADSLADGRGWTYPFGEVGAPVTLFPPLYPAVLAIPASIGMDPFAWVLWQNALLLVVFTLVVGAVVLSATRGSAFASVVAMIVTLLGMPTVATYSRVWSETFFLPLVVGVLATVGRFLVRGRLRWLVVAGVLSSLAMVTRYAGLSLLATVCLVLALAPGKRGVERLRAIGIYAAVALPLSAAWVVRNQLRSGTLTGDNELIHGLDLADVIDGLGTMGSWLVHDPIADPSQWPSVVAFVVVVLVVLAGLIEAVTRERANMPSPSPIAWVCLAYVIVHFTFIAVANAFSTRAPPFNDRLLGPAFAPLVIAVVVIGHDLWSSPRWRPMMRGAVAVGAIALLASSSIAAVGTVPRNFGTEVRSREQLSELSGILEGVLDRDAEQFSNRANVAWFVLDVPVSSLPESCRGGRVLPSLTYERDLRRLSEHLADRPRQVYVFQNRAECEPYSLEELMRELRLERRGRGPRILVLGGPA